MVATDVPPVLIAGAGPTGLVLALVLLKNGIKVRIIDKDEEYHEGSRGPGLHIRTLELLDQLGLLASIAKYTSTVPLVRAYKMPEGREPIKTYSMVEFVEKTPSMPINEPVIIGQNDLEALLREHLKPHGCEVELGKELVKFEQDENGVMAELLDTRDGKKVKETVRSRYLVGADGAKGITRKLLDLTFVGQTRETDAYIVGDMEILNLDNEYWHNWETDNVKFLVRPVSTSNQWFQFAAIFNDSKPSSSPPPLLQLAEFQQFLKKTINRPEIEFGEVAWFSHFRPNMRMVNKFMEGRVFVAGDAAHVHPPSGGQGLNSGVQDSINLAWKLVLSIRGLSKPTLLDTYTEERLPVIAEMLRRTTGLYTAEFVAKKKTQDENKSNGMNGDKSADFYRPKVLFMLDINYRWSSIVLEGRVPGEKMEDKETMKAHAYGGYEGVSLCAGDRAPDAPGLVVLDANSNANARIQRGEETTIFRILDPTKHTVLIFAPSPGTRLTSALEALHAFPHSTVQSVVIFDRDAHDKSTAIAHGADLVVLDRDKHAKDSYQIDDGDLTVVIIRPDSYIGGIIKEAEDIRTYAHTIFRH